MLVMGGGPAALKRVTKTCHVHGRPLEGYLDANIWVLGWRSAFHPPHTHTHTPPAVLPYGKGGEFTNLITSLYRFGVSFQPQDPAVRSLARPNRSDRRSTTLEQMQGFSFVASIPSLIFVRRGS